jgi:hypothetical protein
MKEDGGTKVQVPLFIKARNSSNIASRHTACLTADVKHVGSVSLLVMEAIKARGIEYLDGNLDHLRLM